MFYKRICFSLLLLIIMGSMTHLEAQDKGDEADHPAINQAYEAPWINNMEQQDILLKKYRGLVPGTKTPQKSMAVLDHEKPDAYWNVRNTGSNELSSFFHRNVFIDDDARVFLFADFYGQNAIDIYDGSSWDHLDVGEELPSTVNDMIQDEEGNYIFFTNQGAYLYNTDFVKQDSMVLAEDDTMSNEIITGVIDSEGQLWMAHNPQYNFNYNTNQQELQKVGGFTVLNTSDGTLVARSDTMNSGLESSMMANGVNDLTIGSNGQVWASTVATDSTPGGVAVYDPSLNSAESYTSDNGLPNERAGALEMDANGNMWVTFSDTADRVASFDGTDWTAYNKNNSNLENRCWSLALGSDDQLYCGADSTTKVFDGSAWTDLEESVDGQAVSDVRAIASNQSELDVFVNYNFSPNGALRSGVFVRDSEEWSYMSSHNDNGLFSNIIFALATDQDNGLWASGFRGAAYYDGTDWTYYNANDGLASSYSWRIHVGSDGTVWFGNAGTGITYLRDGEFTVYDEHGTFAETIFEDSQENIWMGSYSNNGILQYDGSEFIHHDTLDGVIGQYVTSLAEGPEGDIYAGTLAGSSQSHLARYDGSEWANWTPDSSESFYSGEIASDLNQNIWMMGDSLLKWDGEELTEYAYPQEEFPQWAYHIEPDPEGNIWLGTANDVYVFNIEEEAWRHPFHGEEGGAPYIIKHDNTDNTYIGVYLGESGIYKYSRQSALPTEKGPEVPEQFTLEQNYPNPFNPTTNISYNLPQAVNNLTLNVYNILGKKVATLVSGQNKAAGNHQVTFDASGLSSGMYIYRLESEQFTASKKMMLIK